MSRILYVGDMLDGLAKLPDGFVRCVVTSPPYWGLRDYGTARWTGGDPDCDHKHKTKHQAQGASSQRAGRANVEAQRCENFRSVCGVCGARRTDRQIGQEATYLEYVTRLVSVFGAVWRVLAPDGTLWLNLGDCYASGVGNQDNARKGFRGDHPCDPKRNTAAIPLGAAAQPNRMPQPGLKPKDLAGVPWRVALALQTAGWWLRSDIVWAKPNPMPESVTDRPTRSHEYLFLLTRGERYHYDYEAVLEPTVGSNEHDVTGQGYHAPGQTPQKGNRRRRSGSGNLARKLANGADSRPNTHLGRNVSYQYTGKGRNRRDVWTLPTQPYKGAHFAVFPEALVEPCILAGSRPGDIVLDPFCGSGTTGAVATRLGRHFVGIELNPEYAALAAQRVPGIEVCSL